MTIGRGAGDATTLDLREVRAARRTRFWKEGTALGGLFLCGALAFGAGAYAFTQFLKPLATEFGWGRQVLGGLMSAFWLAAPFTVVSAYLLDRVGIRTLILVGGLLEALGAIGMTLASEPTQFYLLRFCMGVGKVIMVTPIPATAARWFPRRPGLAIAITFCGWHVGGLIMAPLSAELVASLGWRHALGWVSAIIITGVCVSVAMLRDPRDRIDEETRQPIAALTPAGGAGTSASRLHVPGLAVICLSTIAYYMGYTGLLGQLSPLLADGGFTSREIGALTGSVAISAVIGVLLAGGITESVSTRFSGSGTLLLMGVAVSGATLVGPAVAHWVPYAVVILLGALAGGGDPIMIDALRREVSRRQFARAYGWWYLLCLSACAAGPWVVGAAFDRTGSYRPVFTTIGIACVLAASLWLAGIRRSRATSA
jgi:MFS family permease